MKLIESIYYIFCSYICMKMTTEELGKNLLESSFVIISRTLLPSFLPNQIFIDLPKRIKPIINWAGQPSAEVLLFLMIHSSFRGCSSKQIFDTVTTIFPPSICFVLFSVAFRFQHTFFTNNLLPNRLDVQRFISDLKFRRCYFLL